MPHTTARFLFEHRICGALAHLSARLFGDAGDRPRRSWALRLDAQGHLREVVHPGGERTLHEVLEGWRTDEVPFLFFDPFEPDEYTFIAWHRVSSAALERILDLRLGAEDLACFPGMEGAPLEAIPESHEVMF